VRVGGVPGGEEVLHVLTKLGLKEAAEVVVRHAGRKGELPHPRVRRGKKKVGELLRGGLPRGRGCEVELLRDREEAAADLRLDGIGDRVAVRVDGFSDKTGGAVEGFLVG